MQYRRLGNSGLEVSALAFGAWQLGDPNYWGPDADVDAEAAVREAIDAGITLFDTAETYGDGASEAVLGKALGARRKDVLIASKVAPANCGRGQVRASCEASLRRLATDYIDLYQVHWPIRDHAIDTAFGELDALRQEGKIRHIGVSNFGPCDLAEWMAIGDATSNQLGYNLLFRAIEYEIVPACQRYALGILAYMPLLQGILAGRWDRADDMPMLRRRTRHFRPGRDGMMHDEPGAEDLTFETLRAIRRVAEGLGESMATVALAWTMAKPGITSVIVGARKPSQLRRNLAAADLDLGDALAELDTITGPLKTQLGPNADMWKAGMEARIR